MIIEHRPIAVDISFPTVLSHKASWVGPLLLNVKRMAAMVHVHEFISFQFISILAIKKYFFKLYATELYKILKLIKSKIYN